MGKIEGAAADIVACLIGWAVCFSCLATAFWLGRWAAPFLGWTDDPDMAGLLSAITLVWIYEHQRAGERHSQVLRTLDGLPR